MEVWLRIGEEKEKEESIGPIGLPQLQTLSKATTNKPKHSLITTKT